MLGLRNSAIAISAAFRIEAAAAPALPGAETGSITATRTAPAGATGGPGCTGVIGVPTTGGGSGAGDVEIPRSWNVPPPHAARPLASANAKAPRRSMRRKDIPSCGETLAISAPVKRIHAPAEARNYSQRKV